MFRRVSLALAIMAVFLVPRPVQAQNIPLEQGVDFSFLVPAALVLLLPIGLILLVSSAAPDDKAPVVATNLLMTWALATLAYFAVGFAFQFGGIAQVSPRPDLSGLYWEWYPLDQSVDVDVARLWGVLALRGWFLVGEASTPGALQLFLTHSSLVGVVALIPAAVLLVKERLSAALVTGFVTGALIYPLAGNWLWGGGWLFHLGTSLEMGHGLVDFGGASILFLLGSTVALTALILFRPQTEPEADVAQPVPDSTPALESEVLATTPMPSAYLPILSMLGGGFLLLGWFGLTSGLHTPTAINIAPTQAAVAGLLAALAGATAAAGYSAFTTRTFNPLMTARGLAAGLIVSVAAAPFAPVWVFVPAGLIMGLLTPLLIYLFDQRLGYLVDSLGVITTFGVSAVLSLLLVAFFADGRAGQGWNSVGLSEYRGVVDQGVSGLFVASGLAPNFSGQLQAQLLGGGAIIVWGLITGLVLYQTLLVITDSWTQSRLKDVETGSTTVEENVRYEQPGVTAEIELTEASDDGPGVAQQVPRARY